MSKYLINSDENYKSANNKNSPPISLLYSIFTAATPEIHLKSRSENRIKAQERIRAIEISE